MRFYRLYPSAPEDATALRYLDGHPEVVESAEFLFDMEMSHEIFERFGVCAVTDSLAAELGGSALTGYAFGAASALVSPGSGMDESRLPSIVCLAIFGEPAVDDIGRDSRGWITVSQPFYELLESRDPSISEDVRVLGPDGKVTY
ncbi:MAG: hypothetical protein QM658_00680 [Gordonia sp. (in: high G+C Gram-positive bacteria)]